LDIRGRDNKVENNRGEIVERVINREKTKEIF
jgi:hypothetical protein